MFFISIFSISFNKIGITEWLNRQFLCLFNTKLERSERAGEDPGERGDYRIHVHMSL